MRLTNEVEAAKNERDMARTMGAEVRERERIAKCRAQKFRLALRIAKEKVYKHRVALIISRLYLGCILYYILCLGAMDRSNYACHEFICSHVYNV